MLVSLQSVTLYIVSNSHTKINQLEFPKFISENKDGWVKHFLDSDQWTFQWKLCHNRRLWRILWVNTLSVCYTRKVAVPVFSLGLRGEGEGICRAAGGITWIIQTVVLHNLFPRTTGCPSWEHLPLYMATEWRVAVYSPLIPLVVISHPPTKS